MTTTTTTTNRKQGQQSPVWNKGLKWPDEVKERIKQGMHRYWNEMDDEKRQRLLSELHNQNVYWNKHRRKKQQKQQGANAQS